MKPRYLVCIVNHNKKVFVQYTVHVTFFTDKNSLLRFPFAYDGDYVDEYEVDIYPTIYQNRDECNKKITEINEHYHDLGYNWESIDERVYKISNKLDRIFDTKQERGNVLTLKLSDVINYGSIYLTVSNPSPRETDVDDLSMTENGKFTKYDDKKYNPYFCILHEGVIYQPVIIKNVEQLHDRSFPLHQLANCYEILENFRQIFSSYTQVNVIYEDTLKVESYVKGPLCYISNGGIQCVFNGDELILINLAKQNILRCQDPYNYTEKLRQSFRSIRESMKYKNGKYYVCKLVKGIREDIPLEIRPSLFTDAN